MAVHFEILPLKWTRDSTGEWTAPGCGVTYRVRPRNYAHKQWDDEKAPPEYCFDANDERNPDSFFTCRCVLHGKYQCEKDHVVRISAFLTLV